MAQQTMNHHDKLKQVVDRKDRTGYANKDMLKI